MSRRELGALTVVALAGCGSLTSYRTAEPVPCGQTRVEVATDAAVYRDRPQDSRTPAAHVEVAVRRGLGADADATLKLFVPGVELGVQRRFADGRWQYAGAAAVGVAHTRAGTGATDALYGHLRLTGLATRRTSPRWAFTVGPVVTAGLFVPAGGGHATGLLIGGLASAERRFAGAWQVAPELSLHLTAAGDVPVDGAVLVVGAAVGRRW